MQCEAFERRLQHLLDERELPEEDAALADHAAGCPTCREVLDTQAGLFDTVRDWSVADLEIDLVDRVLVRTAAPAASAHAASAPKRRWWWPGDWRRGSAGWISLAVAAALIAVAWKGVDWYGSRIAQPSTHRVAPESNDFAHDDAPVDRQSPQEFAPLDFRAITQEAAESLGSRIAWGVHYLHRGQSAVTGALLGQFPRRGDEPNARSSSLLFRAAAAAVVA